MPNPIVNRRVVFTKTSGDYKFSNSNAETYFTALETAGFTEAQSLSLYSLDFNTIKEKIDNYFVSIASAGVDTSMTAMYLFIGGTAATHAINAINPGTFDLTFINSPTQSATGTAWNGTTQYAKTGIVPNVDLNTDDIGLSCYTRFGTSINRCIGSRNTTTKTLECIINRSGIDQFNCYNTTGGKFTVTEVDGKGLFSFIRTANNAAKIYKNGSSLGGSAGTSGSNPPTYELYIAARNNTGTADGFAGDENPYVSIGDSFTNTEEANHYTAVQQLQTDLSRQV